MSNNGGTRRTNRAAQNSRCSRPCQNATPGGAIAQNVYLFAASAGLETVIRGWLDRTAVAAAIGLSAKEHVLLTQTVGFAKTSER